MTQKAIYSWIVVTVGIKGRRFLVLAELSLGTECACEIILFEQQIGTDTKPAARQGLSLIIRPMFYTQNDA